MSTPERGHELLANVYDSATLGSHVEEIAELQEEPVLDPAHA